MCGLHVGCVRYVRGTAGRVLPWTSIPLRRGAGSASNVTGIGYRLRGNPSNDMDLSDAIYALDELAAGRAPDETRTSRGLEALAPLLPVGDAELHEAAALLELFLATGTPSFGDESRDRARLLAAAVRRAMSP